MNRKGIAIVTSIIVLVVIMALGTGVLFLTNTNLKSSENVRSNAIAEANAQSGMDVVSLLVRESYISSTNTSCTQTGTANGTVNGTTTGTTKCFPSSISLPTNSTYSLAGYTRTSATQATVKIAGNSASGGQFVSEAIIKMNPGPTNLPPAFGMGLASEGMVTVNGGASLFVDAAVHGNTGINLGGRFVACGARVGTRCIDLLDLDEAQVSIGSATATCFLRNNAYSGICTNRAALVREPVVINPDYYIRRNKVADLNGDGAFTATGFSTSSDCAGATVASSLSSAASNQKYCVNGNVNLTANPLVLSDTTIIASGNINISGNATLTNVNIISLGGTVSFGSNVTATGSRVFSEGSLGLSSNSMTWTGMNTVATHGSLTFNGANNTTSVTASPSGSTVGLAIIADGNITFNGRNIATDYFATFIAGGTLTQNGRSNFYGTISSKGGLTFNGNFFIDAGFDISNTDLFEPGDPYLSTLVRR